MSRSFELAETGETLELDTSVRVHEEITVHRTRRMRTQVVGTTLRRELAEVTGPNDPDATP